MERMKYTLRIIHNIVRLLVAVSFVIVFLSDLHGIIVNPDIYEKVYTGSFLGENRYETLKELKCSLWGNIAISVFYFILVVLHITKMKNSIILTWILGILDIIVVVFIYYSVYQLYSLV